ncbi:Hypothetical protein (Fragment), partial [Durusdinium trenchii]
MSEALEAALRDIIGPLETSHLKDLLHRAENDVAKAVNLHYDANATPRSASGAPGTSAPSGGEGSGARKRPSSILDFSTKRPATGEVAGPPGATTSAATSKGTTSVAPLAERMRPERLEDLVGQEEGLSASLRQAVQ